MDIAGLTAAFGGFFWVIAAFVIALSVIVAVHEYGHYIVGRWCGIHAEVFSLGFGPVVWSRHDKRGTKWQLAALPLGGFVKFLGDADAASGKDGAQMEQMDAAARRRTMHGAPLWARAATVAAGPIFNFIMSIIVFGLLILSTGIPKEPFTIDSVLPLPEVASGLQPGDQVTAVNGEPVASFEEFILASREIPDDQLTEYTIERDGATTVVEGPHPYPPIAAGIHPISAAMDAGLIKNDVITKIDGMPIVAFSQMQEIVRNSDGRALLLEVWRDGKLMDFTLRPRQSDQPTEDGFENMWLIGMYGAPFITPINETPGPWTVVTYGVERTVGVVTNSLSGLYHLVRGAISTCNLSGPITIAKTSGATASQGLVEFISFIAILSTAVGLMNLFPIPVLDGGHLVFHAYEAVFRRPPPDGALRVLMGTGLVLLLSLMVFALGNDVFCRWLSII
ncbi:RIP metalloprotease RseP [Actibacterium sp. 188UL27-1]|uniref:RIP metalloprotease RseP n=1 Tax=Actibacterium sp. 188UL27-1 TaxID=2786961 RepID=UPI00195AE6A8|nr:RIP metalloprotease RseP [Actibacterium sp. 188UL27-1]MBM7067712.1 RIP metalloprotease RseP [Actibacterium sp. 188UL27-1]